MSEGTVISSPAEPTSAALGYKVDARGPLIVGAIVAVVFTWVFWDFIFRQFRFATTQVSDWGHTLVIPAIAGYFIYLRRRELMATPFRTTWIAFLPIVVGVAWYMLCTFGPQVLWHHNLRGAGFSLALFGLVLLFFGWRAMWILAFPLLYLVVFGQTISDRFMEIVTFKLQDITARGAEIVMTIMGMEITRQGNTLYLWEAGSSDPIPLNIAEACSGMRMLMAFLALGVAMAYTGLSRFWQRGILVLLALPTAVAVNVLRVVTLAQLGRLDMNLTVGEFHKFVGLVWLVPAFLIYLALVWIIRHIIIEKPSGGSSSNSSNCGSSSGAGRAITPGGNRIESTVGQ